MQLALYGSIAWRHPLGIGQVIDWACDYGWDAVDARGISLDVEGDLRQRLGAFGYDMLGPRQIRGSAREALRTRLEHSGKRLLGIYCSSPVNLPGVRGDAARELCREYVQLGADLDVEWIRPINNTQRIDENDAMSPEEAYDRTLAGMREVGEIARKLGIGLLLENNENTSTPDPDSLIRMQDDLGEVCNVGIAYDACNAYFQGTDPVAGFDVLAGRIDILHLKNAVRHQDARWDYVPRGGASYEWTSLADGDLDWPALIQKAKAGGFDGPLVYEYVNPFKGMPLSYWDTLPEPEEAARREGAYLRGLVEGAKG